MDDIFSSYDALPYYLRMDEVARLLRISRANAYNLSHAEGFPVTLVGGRRLVAKDDLRAWIQAQQNHAK